MAVVLNNVVLFLGAFILLFGLIKLLYVPLALIFSYLARRRRAKARWTYLDDQPSVSVVVPGYNEEAVIENCVSSILASNYPYLEVVLVDDGSTDRTAELMQRFSQEDPRVRFIPQENAGKGAALNHGTRESSGEVLMYVDSDGIFGPDTIEEMLRGFNHSKVGAVCGDDRPVNLNTVQTRLLTVISHVGTGLVRRALTILHCLPIVSGNVGAFRRDALALTGPLDEHTIGEDLELTWRMHRAGFRVNFAPRALVHAESPSTIRGLWKQRVRWARGLLQTLQQHRRMVGNPRYGVFGVYLLINAISMVVIPILQIVVLFCIPLLLLYRVNTLPTDMISVVLWLGLLVSLFLCLYAMTLNKSLGDVKYLWTMPLWPIYSVFVGLTMIAALVQEITRRPSVWNKLERTGVVSIAR